MTEEVEEVQEVQEAPPEPNPAEDEARKYGWKSKDEFDLPPEGWVDADRFLELPSTQNKALRDTQRSLEKQIKSLEENTESFEERTRRIEATYQDAMKRQRERDKAEYEAKLAEITEGQRRAVEEADTEQFERLQQKKEALQPPKAEQDEGPQQDPDVAKYRASNKWTEDAILWDFAVQAVQRNPAIQAQSATEQLKYAEQVTKEYFPQKFEAPKPQVQKVDPGGLAAPAKPRGVNALPAEAKAAGRAFVEDGIFKDMEEYAKSYWTTLEE